MRDITSDGFVQWFDGEQRKPTDAVMTPFHSLNKACYGDGGGEGLARGWFVTVGGNPGFGKSLVAMNFCATAMRLVGEPIGYVTLEMTAREIAQRVYAITTDQNIRHFEKREYNANALTPIRELPNFYVPDSVAHRWETVVQTFTEMYEEGVRYFVLDYLQLVQAGNERTVFEAVAETVTYLRAWALNNGCVMLCLSQFNRETSKNYQDKPVSQSLWGGMLLEASSDLVLLLDHSRYTKVGNTGARTWLLCDKNRHGPRVEIPIQWDWQTLQCTEGKGGEGWAS